MPASFFQPRRRRQRPKAASSSGNRDSGIPSSRILPLISAGCVFLFLAALLLVWHDEKMVHYYGSTANLQVYQQQHASSGAAAAEQRRAQRRFLQDMIADVNDDITRDETCKEYMSKFLNGTTDFKDECQGMYNAYQAADCSDDTAILAAQQQAQQQTQSSSFSFLQKKHHHKQDDNNSTDDDVMIDDWYEQWQCCGSIFEYYNAHCREPELDSGRLLGIVGVLVVCSIVKSLIQQGMGLEWLPDAAIYVMVGAVAGGICRLVAPDVVAERLTFNNDLFLHILLPPIIFQAALTIDKRSFRRHLLPILSFSILGTVVSAVAVGLITYYLTSLGGGTHLPLLDSLLFGTLISSIDPVATLGILSSVGVSQQDTLYTLIFGESLLNDGVAIVLFDALVKHLRAGPGVDQATVTDILGRFFMTACGSMLIGLVCGGCCALYFYTLWGKHTAVTEVAIFFSWALIPFYLADLCGGSGIIAIMVMGFFLDYYVVGGNQSDEGEWMDFMHLRCTNNDRVRSEGDLEGVASEPVAEPSRCGRLKLAWSRTFSGRGHILSKSRHHVGFVAEVIADIMETAIFTYLGLFLLNDNSEWDWKLNGVAIFGCIFSRLGMVVLISAIINLLIVVDCEGVLTRFFRKVWSDLTSNENNRADGVARSTRTAMSAPLLGDGHYDDEPPTGEEEDDDDDDSRASISKRYLDMRTQSMLLLAGVRGAVSFALVANVPVYNVVTKQGSQFKAELKAMTSSSILFTLFVFGALTYFMVKNETDPNRERIAGNFTHRLISMPLESDNEGEDDSDGLASSLLQLEIEASPPRRTRVISFE